MTPRLPSAEPHVGDTGVPEGEARIELRQGRNLWRLMRTDRDGASEEQVIETVGPAVSKMIREAGMQDGPWEILRTDSGGNPKWRIGNARPVELVGLARYEPENPAGPQLALPEGAQRIAERLQYPGPTLPTVAGKRPWWVLVDVWWRGPDTTIYWPGFRVNWLGNRVRTVVGADWALDSAAWVPDEEETKPDPGDQTSLGSHATTVSGAAAQALKFALPPVVLIGGIALGTYAAVKSGVFSKMLKGRK